MDLETGVRRLQHHIPVGRVDFVRAGQVEVVRLAAAQPRQGLVQHAVARQRRHVLEVQVREFQRREDPGEQHIGPHPPGGVRSPGHHLLEARLHPRQEVSRQRQRVEVRLQVEPGDLGGEPGVVQFPQDFHRQRRRTVGVADQEHLLFDADPVHPFLDPPVGDHPVQRPEVAEQALLESAQFLAGDGAGVQTAHLRAGF